MVKHAGSNTQHLGRGSFLASPVQKAPRCHVVFGGKAGGGALGAASPSSFAPALLFRPVLIRSISVETGSASSAGWPRASAARTSETSETRLETLETRLATAPATPVKRSATERRASK